MTKKQSPNLTSDEILIEERMLQNWKYFRAYNKLRIQRVLEILPKRKQPVFEILPLLLHTNHPALPGYIDHPDLPFGVSHFRYSDVCLEAVAKVFPSARLSQESLKESASKQLCIKSLLLMGSVGTAAQSAKSDFDFWVCLLQDKYTPEQLKLLQDKFTAVENWAQQRYELEVHFFFTDIKRVQNNDFGGADQESAGSSLAKLLKDEFYRTAVLVSGRTPLWWITPGDGDATTYEKCRQVAKVSERIHSDRLVDLGDLHQISSEEYFGAAIWQLSKGMDSPFKSVMKMATLLVYLDPEETSPPLCTVMKQRVQVCMPKDDEDRTYDPYTLMFDTIHFYYHGKEDEKILELLKICMFIKSQMTPEEIFETPKPNFKQRIMRTYTKLWAWDRATIENFCSFRDWDMDKVISLGKGLHNFLLRSYKELSKQLKTLEGPEQIIKPQDITILGRKLESFYNQKPNKIPFIKRAFSSGLWLESVTVHGDFTQPREQHWKIYQGQLSKQNLKTSCNLVLRQGENLAEMLIWAAFNRIIDENTSVYLIPNRSPLVMTELQDIVQEIIKCFANIKISAIPNQKLLINATKEKMLLVVNFESPRFEKKLESVTIAYLTSWGELYCQTFKTEIAEHIKETLVAEPQWGSIHYRDKCHLYIPKGAAHSNLVQTIEGLLEPQVSRPKLKSAS